jgi:hypothetical protein
MSARGSNWFFVDVEARGTSPCRGTMTEFGVVHYLTKMTFHGVLYEGTPDPRNPAVPVIGKQVATAGVRTKQLIEWLYACNPTPGSKTMWSDNPAYDYMWIAGMCDDANLPNPFGHSARRISDFYAGLNRKVGATQDWKKYRKTPHDHNPVNDAMGNVEAMAKILEIHVD